MYIVLIGTQATTDKIDLELVQKTEFEPGTAETFSVEGVDVGEIRKIEVGEWEYRRDVRNPSVTSIPGYLRWIYISWISIRLLEF